MSDLAHVHAGLLRETYPGEQRVALTPADVDRLARRMAVSFEPGCGAAAGHEDEAYAAAGAKPAGLNDIAADCQIIVGVRRPQAAAFQSAAVLLFLGTDVVSLHGSRPADDGAPLELDLAGLESMRDAGSMDVATTQATISGHAAVLEGARQLGVGHPMLVIDGGFVRPVRMAAFGADAASLQAIATARRLGALTYAFAFTDEERRKNERLGAKVLAAYPSLAMTGAGQSSPHRAALRRQLAGHLAQMQLIVTSVGDSMRAAPLLLDEETMSSLAAGTVVIDLAASRGGNCSLTRVDEVVTANGVRVLGLTTFASHEAKEASRLFGKGMRSVLERLVGDDGRVRLDGPDPILARLLASLSRGTRIAC